MHLFPHFLLFNTTVNSALVNIDLTISPLHGFRVPGFTFWQWRVSSWVSGFGFRKVWVTSWVSGFVQSAGYKLRWVSGFGST